MTALNELEVSKSSLWRAGLPAVFLGWVWARLCIASGFLTAHLLVDQLETPRGSEQIQQGLFTWDGAFYRGLAQQWYTRPLGGAAGSLAGEEARFFPVYPALAKALGPLLGGHADWALIAISNIAAFLGAWVLWKLATEVLQGQDQDQDQGEAASTLRRSSKGRSVEGRSVADRSAVLIAIFPAAFVLAFAYSEGLALLVVAGTLLALQRRNFVMAGLLALLAAAIRPVGGLLLVPIAIELLRAQPRPRWWNWIIGLGGPFLGFGLALIWIERSTGELLLPLRLQRQIRGGFQDPLTRVLEPVGELIRGNFRDVYNLGFMVVFLSLFVFMLLGARRSGPKLPTSWIAYSGVSLLLMLSSQVTDSLGRYGLLVVPFIVALAMWADRRWRMIAVGIACSAGLIWLTSEALLGRLVP
ncbi:MAG: hypothetical protein F2942_02220 [Actinobacteria bacterium]|uniref:Unannotated protein n=1 Tax=freshwater metagenome TaxID=449393 RepID=A0A6J7UBQ3_9ZZZZ|nr:hypothetical protein [Actinomycetota bacterium]MSX75117.1 hypothetical protein [Actinomycetota bacterium]MTA73508.1 hypothetical protein [Actinomycetota bacterium]